MSFWRQLFPQAFVYCIDRDLVDRWEPNTGLLRADQSNPDHLQRVIETVRHPISLIIDDGSHHPRHQSLSFSLLFKQLLQPGGLYIIEDIETSYWRRGSIYDYNYNFGLGDQQSAIGAFKTLADHVNRRFLDPADRNLLLCRLLDAGIDPEAADEVEMVSFGRNVVSVSRCLEPNAASTLPGYAYLNLTSRS